MLYLIRHAESEMNRAALDWTARHPGDLSVHWDLRLVDADLTPVGESQLAGSRDLAQSLPVTKVYVSPLRRTLKTCRGLFSGHPDSPEVCLEPLMTEVITDIGDVSLGANVWRRDFSEYDWTAMDMLDPAFWMFDIVSSPAMRRLESLAKGGAPLYQTCATLMQTLSPTHFEPAEYAVARMEAFKSLLLEDLAQGETLAVVGHSDFWKLFTKSVCGAEVALANCEIRHFPLEPEATVARL